MIEKWITALWQKRTWGLLPLLPFSLLYWVISQGRRFLYEKHLLRRYQAPIPVIVIGNISVGGTGKTPLTLFLANTLQAQGFFPGIISRGYKSRITSPKQVTPSSDPRECGDEPVLMAQHTNAPIFIYPKRALAIKALCQTYPQCDVILCDDGLQHYALQRDLEIAVIDAARPVGNGFLLPAGPLRERLTRLRQVDFVVFNGPEPVFLPPMHTPTIRMRLQPGFFYQLTQPDVQQDATHFFGQHCHAIAGIGHPARFFNSLQTLGLQCAHTAFPDHYTFTATDLPACDIIFVTEKDAVKLTGLKDDRIWVLPVNAVTEPDLAPLLVTRLSAIRAAHYG